MLDNFPFATGGKILAPVTVTRLIDGPSLQLVVPSFDGYVYVIDGITACAGVAFLHRSLTPRPPKAHRRASPRPRRTHPTHYPAVLNGRLNPTASAATSPRSSQKLTPYSPGHAVQMRSTSAT